MPKRSILTAAGFALVLQACITPYQIRSSANAAPKYTGKNVINPLATICAGGMMMDTLGESKVAEAIDKAVHQALDSKQIKSLAAGKMGMGTREVGDLIAKLVS